MTTNKKHKHTYRTLGEFDVNYHQRTPLLCFVNNKIKISNKKLQKMSTTKLMSIAYFCCNKGFKQLLIDHINNNKHSE